MKFSRSPWCTREQPQTHILSFAQARKTDLIVMGTHGRRGCDRLVLGSVTDRVMRRAPCPVLAICKPPHDSMAAGEERHTSTT